MPAPAENPERAAVLARILDIELAMFLSVKSLTPASCQEDPERFRVMRAAQFSAWGNATLESYLDDLVQADTSGRNLMTEKYARMDDIIPPLSESPAIQEIVAIQVKWQRKLAERYPMVMGRGRGVSDQEAEGRGTSFERYLKGELETYSERTLQLLLKDAREYEKGNENMARIIYEAMVRELGYESLDEAEAAISARR